MSERTCLCCAETFQGRSDQRYCAAGCQKQARNQTRLTVKREALRARRADIVCLTCGASLADRRATRYCSKRCNDIARGMVRAEPLPARVCLLSECDQDFVPRGEWQFCCCEHHGRLHCQRTRRADGRDVRPPWNDAQRDAWHRRRAIQKGATTGRPVILADIAERDGWVCGICHRSVDSALAWPDRMSASLDHVIALARGGAHDPENVQLSHVHCNVAKGAGQKLSNQKLSKRS